MEWSEILKKYTVELVEFIKATKDLAVKEIPLFLQELIKYELWSSMVSILFNVAYILAIVLIARWSLIKLDAFKFDDSDSRVVLKTVLRLVTVICVIITAGFLFDNVNHAVKVKVAPRLIIVEKVQEYIGSTNTQGGSCGR